MANKKDTLFSVDVVEFTLGLCEGPIAGLKDGSKTFYLNDTPLKSRSGATNFDPMELHVYHGEDNPSQVKQELGQGSTSTYQVGVNLDRGNGVVRTTPTTLRGQIDVLEVRLNIAQLWGTTKKGETRVRTLEFKIEYRQAGHSTWLSFFSTTVKKLKGKTQTGTIREYRKSVPRTDNDWEIRVTFVNPATVTSGEQTHANLVWESYQLITQDYKKYPNLAVARALVQASDQISSIPAMTGVYNAKIVKVPSNYDPRLRYYNGVWNGTFKQAHTNNPAWILYDLLDNAEYGARYYIPDLQLDRFSFYEAAQWCDELVPRPAGGYQPRWTYSERIDRTRSLTDTVQYIMGIFGGVLVEDVTGGYSLAVDRPGTVAEIFGPESIVGDEGFQYQRSVSTERVNDIVIDFNNADIGWQQDARRVYDQGLIDANGRVFQRVVAIGCNNVYEAQRRAQRRIVQANTETTMVSFQVARRGINLDLFQLIGIVDPIMGWGLSGRIKSISGSTIYLRDPLYLPVDTPLQMGVQTPTGLQTVTVQTSQLNTLELQIQSGTLSGLPQYAQFAITSNEVGLVKPFRILSIDADPDNSELISITALEHNTNKYSDVDNMTSSETVDYSYEGQEFPNPPVIQEVSSGTEHLYVQSDGRIGSRIYLRWEAAAGSIAREYEVQYELEDGGVTQTLRTRNTDIYLEGVQDAGTYEIQVFAVNRLGRMSQGSTLVTHTVQGKTLAPDAVTGLATRQIGPDVQVSFDPVDDLDIGYYEVTAQFPDGSTQNIGTTTSTSLVHTNVSSSPITYQVGAVDTSGNRGALVPVVHSVETPSSPTASVGFSGSNYTINIQPNSNDEVPVQSYIIEQAGNEIFQGQVSSFSAPADWLGVRTFKIYVVNQAGEKSPAYTVTGTILAPAAPQVSDQLANTRFELNWGNANGTLPISHYIVTDTASGTALATKLQAETFSGEVTWQGSKEFSVQAVDTAGNTSLVTNRTIDVPVPEVLGLTSRVERGTVLLAWKGAPAALPIVNYKVFSGTSFNTAAELATADAELYSAPVTWNGSRTFYVVAYDSAGNTSVPATVTETIDPPAQVPLTASVVNGDIQLSWASAETELLIDRYDVTQALIWSLNLGGSKRSEFEGTNVASSSVGVDFEEMVSTSSIQADSSGKTRGLAFPVPEAQVRQWYNTNLTVRAQLSSTEVTDAHFGYSTNSVGNSNPRSFAVTGTPTWYEFTWKVPTLGSSTYRDHWIGFWADADRSLRIHKIEVISAAALVQSTRSIATAIPPNLLGRGIYTLTPVDTAGNIGSSSSAEINIKPPEEFSLTGNIVGEEVVLQWETPEATLPIEHYEIRRGTDFASSSLVVKTSSNSHAQPADWLGVENFFVVAYDTAGNSSPTQTAEITIAAPDSPQVRSEVIDNNVLLRWTNRPATLPVVATEIRKGSVFDTAEVQQQVDATFATFFEFESGDYAYWLVGIDSAGNYGKEIRLNTTVTEPPDFVLQTSFTSTLDGTLQRALKTDEGVLLGINVTETWEEHFTSNGWNDPQDQINAGLPLFPQPVDPFAVSSYQETYDVGAVLSASIITVTPTITVLDGDGNVQVDVEYRELDTDPWILVTNANRVYAQNFRYIRFTVRLNADSQHDLVQLDRVDVRLNVKLKNDSGSGSAAAADVGGTVVSFNTTFIDVNSVVANPKGSTPAVAIVDFADTINPTEFSVYLFDMSGVRIDGDFTWTARGV